MRAPAPLHGGFAASEMHRVLTRVCAALGVEDSGAELLRGHTNAVVRLKAAPVVVKIARKGTSAASVATTVACVRWLMDQRFPTVPLHPGINQPLVIDDHPVTVWTYLPQHGVTIDAVDLAVPLRALHQLPPPPVGLRGLDNLAAIRTSLTAITTLPAGDLEFLRERADQLQAALAGVDFALEATVLQGDPQHRNALHERGRTVLCDWDTLAWGQPEWDLVTLEIHCRRFGYGRAHYCKFADAYGFDVTAWPGYRVLRGIRELRMVTTNARKASHTPGSITEVRRRIIGLRQQDEDLEWNIL
ncbi:phosphotransferase family protein [Nocardiopsis sp. CNT312]|uniref:phosphotransferase family protein n=1 Tax=Nocardiopsis sp. CNT312 TaxID=1137268 RepID=UPI0004B57271|nr:phosphotransferase [Nocardiopsis sp. CNT312]